ncbi:UDP-glucuronosyl/UDP-glucosyltransferase [Dillenia turbinata]|uniref:Glycosyltransferase n=1 Tax=Dillenia turbinata TaxID=194707 RepID=A0AAN8V5Z8_9MAGN
MGNNIQDQNDQNKAPQHQVTVVLVPFPAQGHLNQAIHLSRILSSYSLPVHYVGSAIHNRQARERVHGWDPHSATNLHFHDFQVPFFTSPPPNPNSNTKFPSHLQPSFNASCRIREPVATLLRSLSAKFKRVVVIYDTLMASVVQDVVYLPNAEPYALHSVSAFTVFLYIWESMGKPFDIDDRIFSEEWNIPSIEGCFSFEFLNFMAGQYRFANLYRGKLYNTSRVIEAPYVDLLAREEVNGRKTQWAIGPLNPVNVSKGTKPNDKQRNHCLKWLDKQNPNSVMFISFGSTTCMQDEQIVELAIGLLKSEQKFIWLLRDADKGNVFERENENYVERVFQLPKGYEENVKDRGLIVREWAPQLEILEHPSTGGFMSHCGWNSCMESISNGIPIAAWPMHSDQPRNTVLVTQVLKIGVVVRDWDKRQEIVRSWIIENAVRKLMASKEGDDMRKRAQKLGFEARRSAEDGGVSRLELDAFVAHITR